MDINYTSASSLSEHEENSNLMNANIPSYLYTEIPTVFAVIGIMLDIAITIYFIKSRKYRNPIFTILTCLAVTDTYVCAGGAMIILIVPKVVTAEAGFMCVITALLTISGPLGSEYTLIFFAGVRLYQVLAPLKAMASITVSLMLKCCATINVVYFGLGLLHAVFWHPITTDVNGEYITLCIFTGDDYSRDLTLMIVLTGIPCLTILLLHILKYLAHIRSRRLLETNQERKSPDAHAIAMVIMLFYISWIPAMTYLTVQRIRIDDYVYTQDMLYIVLIRVAYAHSILNPLVYVLAMKSIRDNFINVFCSTKQANSV